MHATCPVYCILPDFITFISAVGPFPCCWAPDRAGSPPSDHLMAPSAPAGRYGGSWHDPGICPEALRKTTMTLSWDSVSLAGIRTECYRYISPLGEGGMHVSKQPQA